MGSFGLGDKCCRRYAGGGEARKLASSRVQLGAPIFTELNSVDISSGSAAGVSNKAQNAHGAGLFTEHP